MVTDDQIQGPLKVRNAIAYFTYVFPHVFVSTMVFYCLTSKHKYLVKNEQGK